MDVRGLSLKALRDRQETMDGQELRIRTASHRHSRPPCPDPVSPLAAAAPRTVATDHTRPPEDAGRVTHTVGVEYLAQKGMCHVSSIISVQIMD